MGLIRWLQRSMGKDLIRLHILMDYSAAIRNTGEKAFGTAAVRWSTLSPDVPQDKVDLFRAALITALYAEVLVIDANNRIELTARVDTAVERWKRSDTHRDTQPPRLDFDAWNVKVAGLGSVPLWPWHMIDPKSFELWVKAVPPAFGNPKTYTATLKLDPPTSKAPDGLWAFTEMSAGLAKVCVPASPLIAAHAFGLEMLAAHRPECISTLCFLLDHVNRYYRTLGRFPLGRQSVALAQSLAALRQYASGKN